jgi:hypothetical protein
LETGKLYFVDKDLIAYQLFILSSLEVCRKASPFWNWVDIFLEVPNHNERVCDVKQISLVLLLTFVVNSVNFKQDVFKWKKSHKSNGFS